MSKSSDDAPKDMQDNKDNKMNTLRLDIIILKRIMTHHPKSEHQCYTKEV